MSPSDNKRIAKNTGMLYIRQILILLVGLYTVRVILENLGIEDYGIYNVIGGLVMLFSFLSGTMASATQRFFSFALGKNDTEKLKKTFSVNLIIYFAIAVIAVVLLETIGMWYVEEHLKIPPARYDAAIFLFHFSIFTFIGTMLATPFMAIIIAHEDMHIYAYISILEAFLKLGIVLLLIYIPSDKLKLYGVLLFIVSNINLFSYVAVCLKKYQECQFKEFYWDKALFKQILNFTSWTLFGQVSTVTRNQAITILLNQSFNPVVVAARAIAINASNKINIFSSNFNVGLYPSIIKSYSSGDKEGMFKLIFNGSTMTFFLMWVFALPMFLEMDTILNIWLNTPPPEAILFTRLALVEVLINSISLPLTTAARAPGRMKVYELTLGSIQILIFLVAWIVLKMGGAPYSVYIVAIGANLIMFVVRLLIVSSLIGLEIITYTKKVVIPTFSIITISSVISYLFKHNIPHGLIFSILTFLISILISSISMYYIGLNKDWRLKIRGAIGTQIQTILKY